VTRVWFTSDTHFNHQAIIDYCGRPFRTPDGHLDVQKMNEALVANWNATVGPNDTVYHLGDFAFGPTPLAARWAARLNGHKVLVKGNHDRLTVTAYRSMGFERIEKRWKLGRIYLIHWPPPDFAAPFGCEVVLCGHVHENWARQGDCINVGVDVRGFRPVSLEELGVDPGLIEDA
jgi:calcineurin-like phosphoesterase family protein